MRSTVTDQHPPAWAPGRATAALHVDQDHPFFFDHPLDHVPGMLLVASLLDLVREGVPVGSRLGLSLQFSTLCELDAPTELTATPERQGWSVAAVQGGRSVCEGTVAVRPDTAPAPVISAPSRCRVAAELVHRARRENVVLGEPEQLAGEVRAPILPPTGYLAERGSGGYSALALVEAGRQLATLLSHTVDRHPLDTRLLWCGLDADLPVTLPGGAGLALRCRPEPAKGRKLRYPAALVGAVDGRPHGSVEISCMAVSAASYRRFRARGRAA
jgi:hypothetical protein